MSIELNYCMNCMKEMPEGESICPDCGYNNDSPQNAPFLKKGTIIFEHYLIGKVQSFSADSITYMGMDTESGETLSITEFYPDRIVSRSDNSENLSVKLGYEDIFRDYLQSFLHLWRTIQSLNGTACLPQVIEVIDSNATVYAISRYKDCITLKSYFDDKRTPLPWKKALAAFKPIVAALALLHGKGVCHGNISPDSVCVGADGKIHLTKFSISECYRAESEILTSPVSGFSPLEYYGEIPAIGTYSDVYSMTALLYYSVTGIVPDDAMKRAEHDDMVLPSAIASTLTQKEISVLVKGLSLRRNNRISSAQALYEAIYSGNAVTTKKQSAPPHQGTTKKAVQTNKTKKIPAKNSASKEEEIKSIIPLMIKTFVTVIVICTLLFTALYSTVLYEKVDIPFLNKILSPVSFLPVNKNAPNYPDNSDSTSTPEANTSAGYYETNYVTIPDFESLTYEEIKDNEIYNRDFKIIFKFESNKDFDENAVISQSLPVGESVPSGSEITIIISSGHEQIELIDVIGMDFQIAKEKLEHAGFKVKKNLAANDGKQPVGEVYMMSKVAGLDFDEGTEIELYVWDEVVTETTTKTAETTKKTNTTKKNTENKKETTTKKSAE